MNWDGRPDLLARDTRGNLYLYAGTSTGSFAPRVEIGSGWQSYSLIVGVQVLNGNGAGDVLARDANGVVWRYLGNGHGNFTTRTKIGSGWLMCKYLL